MGHSSQATEHFIPTKLGPSKVQCEMSPHDDQCFLLYFIMGSYFGPDIKGERPKKSVLQRVAEGLPQYNSDQLIRSHMETTEIERVYYYVLRKADRSVVVNIPSLHQFFEGTLPTHGPNSMIGYPQFPDLFPPQLHPRSCSENECKIIQNIVFLNNPETIYIRAEDILRFKKLTRLPSLLLDRDAAKLHTVDSDLCEVSVTGFGINGGLPSLGSSTCSRKTGDADHVLGSEDFQQHANAMVPANSMPYNSSPLMYNCLKSLPKDVLNDEEEVGPAMVFLPSHPTKSEWSEIVSATKSGFALTGTAVMGKVGSVVGLMDIGECEDAYLFRVSLPGVKRDEREFSCEVENDGKVLIRGVTTTGERRVCMCSQVFEMQSQNLSPPGHFSISFKLPGAVVPQQFSGSFGTDGVLEGIIMKGR